MSATAAIDCVTPNDDDGSMTFTSVSSRLPPRTMGYFVVGPIASTTADIWTAEVTSWARDQMPVPLVRAVIDRPVVVGRMIFAEGDEYGGLRAIFEVDSRFRMDGRQCLVPHFANTRADSATGRHLAYVNVRLTAVELVATSMLGIEAQLLRSLDPRHHQHGWPRAANERSRAILISAGTWFNAEGRESRRRRSRYLVPVVTEHEVWSPPRKLRLSDFASRPRLLAHLMATGAEFEPMRRKTPLVPPKPAAPRSVIPARPRASGGVAPGRHMIHDVGGRVVSVGGKPV
jgi:hypothetical protein